MSKNIFSLLLVFGCYVSALSQAPYENEIKAFQHEDSKSPPPENSILFVGSSSFRLWKNLKTDFPKHTIINRGFGGSSLEDVLRYENEIIFKYNPIQVVIYCGENDAAAGASGETVLQRFKQVFVDIRSRLPEASIVFVSMKPSPSRRHVRSEVETGNKLIKTFLETQKQTHFVDVFQLMLNKNDEPRGELFLKDSLHMNSKGYAIWKKAIEPVLTK